MSRSLSALWFAHVFVDTAMSTHSNLFCLEKVEKRSRGRTFGHSAHNGNFLLCSLGGIPDSFPTRPMANRKEQDAHPVLFSGKQDEPYRVAYPSRAEEERREISLSILRSDGVYNTCPDDLTGLILDYAVWDVRHLDVGAHLDVQDAHKNWYAAKILTRDVVCSCDPDTVLTPSARVIPWNHVYGKEKNELILSSCPFPRLEHMASRMHWRMGRRAIRRTRHHGIVPQSDRLSFPTGPSHGGVPFDNVPRENAGA